MKVTAPESESWKQSRLKDWALYSHNKGISEGLDAPNNKAIYESHKQWFIYGNLEPLLHCDGCEYYHLFPLNLWEGCPTESYREFLQIFRDYMMWNSEQGYSHWKEENIETRDGSFFKELKQMVGVSGGYLSPLIREGLFLDVYGKEPRAEIAFPFPLGVDGWVPATNINPADFAFSIKLTFKRYLFGDPEDHAGSLHARSMVDYFCEVLPEFDVDYFALEYHKKAYFNSRGEKISEHGQALLRGFLANLYGYLTEHYDWEREELPHHDIEAENKIRTVLESDRVPGEFKQLIDYIHEKKEKCVYPED